MEVEFLPSLFAMLWKPLQFYSVESFSIVFVTIVKIIVHGVIFCLFIL